MEHLQNNLLKGNTCTNHRSFLLLAAYNSSLVDIAELCVW